MGKTASELSLVLVDSKEGVYFPGGSISGTVTVTLEEPKECINLHVQFLGEADVYWSESRATNTRRGVSYSAKEIYLNAQIILKQSDDGTDKVTLPEGISSYPFTFNLPTSLPASFNSHTGRITYTVISRIKRPWFKFDIKASRIISVIGMLDLNLLSPGALVSSSGDNPEHFQDAFFLEKSKNICCLCCSSGPVEMQVLLPKVSFVSGERLVFSVEMSNLSSQKVSRTLCTLIQTCSFFAEGHSKVVSINVRQLEGPHVVRGGSETWKDSWSPLIIPPLPPSGLGGSTIIDVQYTLKFEIKFKGMSWPLEAEVPIRIGTVPLRSTFQEFKPPPDNRSGVDNKDPNKFIPREQPYGIFGVSNDNGIGLGLQIMNDSQRTPSALVFGMYPDLPAYRFMKSVVHLGETFDLEDPSISLPDERNEESSSSTFFNEEYKYHPFCIYFEPAKNSLFH